MTKKKDAEKKQKPQRERGTGSLYRKSYPRNGHTYKEPTWTIQFYSDGRRVREATGLRDKAAAQRLLNTRLYQVGRAEYTRHAAAPAKVEELYRALHEHFVADGRENTARRLAWQWREHLASAFGYSLASRLTTDRVTAYTAERREQGAAPATINRELAALRRMFRFGMRKTPPVVTAVPYIPMLTENNARRGFVEDADFARLMAATAEPWLQAFLELAYTYGWRRGELLGLRVRQVDLFGETIRLDTGTTKNGEGREVAMTRRVQTLLRQCVVGKRPDDYVFTREDRKPVRDMRDAWRALCVRAGLGSFVCTECGSTISEKRCSACGSRQRRYTGLIIHDLRRSAAKARRRAGVAESVIMAMGGWKTASMFRRYAIVSSADQREANALLERARVNQNGPAFGPAEVKATPTATEPALAKPQ
ncbi:MAG: tyrosine-type recombinase/integrase [Terriglobales bacterium]